MGVDVMMMLVGAIAAFQLWLCRRQLCRVERDGAAYTGALLRLKMITVAAQAGMGIAILAALRWVPPRDPVGAALDVVGVVAAQALIELAGAAVKTFRIDRRYGFSRMRPYDFLYDAARIMMQRCCAAAGLSLLALLVITASGPAWPLWFPPLAALLAYAACGIYSGLVEPARRGYRPLPPGPLTLRLHACRQRCEVGAVELVVERGSVRSTHANARAEQAWGVRRVVLLDTLLQRLPPEQAEAVLAHELGHLRCRHLQRRFAWLTLAWTLAFAAAWWLAGSGVTAAWAPLPVIAVLLGPLRFLLQPLLNRQLRRWELEADAFAAGRVDPVHLRQALLALLQANATAPASDRCYAAFHESHPPLARRLAQLSGA